MLVALSIRQPWAYAVMHLGKDVENRTWSTTFRGRVLVHASAKKPSPFDMADFRETMDGAGVASDLDRDGFDLGGLVGSVEIVDCVQKSSSPWFFGPWGFVLRDPKPLPFMPYRGRLGFFNPDTGVAGFYRHNHGIELLETLE